MTDPFLAEIRIFPYQLRPQGLGDVQRAVDAHLAEHCAVLPPRDAVRREWHQHLRAAELPGERPGPPGAGPRPVPPVRRRVRWQQTPSPSSPRRCLPTTTGSGRTAGDFGDVIAPSGAFVLAKSQGGCDLPTRTNAANLVAAVRRRDPSPTGGSQPHNNLPPYLTLTFCIALQGIFLTPLVAAKAGHRRGTRYMDRRSFLKLVVSWRRRPSCASRSWRRPSRLPRQSRWRRAGCSTRRTGMVASTSVRPTERRGHPTAQPRFGIHLTSLARDKSGRLLATVGYLGRSFALVLGYQQASRG